MIHGEMIQRKVDAFTSDFDLACMVGDEIDLIDCLDTIKQVQKHFRELRNSIEAAIIDHIETTGLDIIVGTSRFYAVHPTKTKRTATHVDILKSILTATSGDLDQLAACLSSSAWLPGASRKTLGDLYAAHFHDTREPSMRRGKAQKRLMKTDVPLPDSVNPGKAVEDYYEGTDDAD